MITKSESSTMAEPVFDHLLTGEEFFELGDIGPCELINGKIVPMPPTGGEDGTVEGNVSFLLKEFVQPRSLGWVLSGEVGIYTRRNPDRICAVDVAFVSKNQFDRIPAGFLEFAPELIIEVVSPTDPWPDLRQKITECFAIGARTLWIVDPKTRTVLVYSSATKATPYNETQTLLGAATLAHLEIPVARIFQDLAI